MTDWTMFDDRLEIEAVLVARADLHVGRLEDLPAPDEKGNRQRLLRDVEGRPLLPASSLKGVLRQRMKEADTVLGYAMDGEDKGQVARLWLEDAPLAEAGPAPEGLDRPDGYCFVTSHVSLDARTAANATNKLFECERVAKGSTFAFRATWFGTEPMDLVAVLAPFVGTLAIGKGTAKGHGRIALDPATLVLTRHRTANDGRMHSSRVDDVETGPLRAALSPSWEKKVDATDTLTLTCEGPFLSVCGTGERVQGEGQTTLPLERDGKPALNPESLIGALRARARWLAEVDRARADPVPVSDIRPPLDDRTRIVGKQADIADLSPVERLFGVTGFAALLHLVEMNADLPADRITLTSVSLDRITGAGREGFLYKEEAFLGTILHVSFSLRASATEADRTFWTHLLDNIAREGLDLGHGASKGFGWFDVERKAPT